MISDDPSFRQYPMAEGDLSASFGCAPDWAAISTILVGAYVLSGSKGLLTKRSYGGLEKAGAGIGIAYGLWVLYRKYVENSCPP